MTRRVREFSSLRDLREAVEVSPVRRTAVGPGLRFFEDLGTLGATDPNGPTGGVVGDGAPYLVIDDQARTVTPRNLYAPWTVYLANGTQVAAEASGAVVIPGTGAEVVIVRDRRGVEVRGFMPQAMLAALDWLGFWTGSALANILPTAAEAMELPVDAPEVGYGYQATQVLTNAEAAGQGYAGADFLGGSALGWGLGGNRGRRAMLNATAPGGITVGAIIHHHPSTPYPIGLSVRNAAATVAWGIVPDQGFYADGNPVNTVPLTAGKHTVLISLQPAGWSLSINGAVVRSGAQAWARSDSLQVGAFVDRGSRGYYNNIFAVRGVVPPAHAASLAAGNVPDSLGRLPP